MLINMYLTMLPVIIGGILNMVFMKTTLYKKHRNPIDFGKSLKDGRRILGDNKTWTGFLSMIIICMAAQAIYGYALDAASLSYRSDLYTVNENTLLYNLTSGFLFGFSYMLFELPNSFIKRRLDIKPGKTQKSLIGIIFFIIDQIDSMFGVILVLYLLSDITPLMYFGYVLVGGLTHISINLVLWSLKIRRNI